jgi:hypothetical protein
LYLSLPLRKFSDFIFYQEIIRTIPTFPAKL